MCGKRVDNIFQNIGNVNIWIISGFFQYYPNKLGNDMIILLILCVLVNVLNSNEDVNCVLNSYIFWQHLIHFKIM